MAKMTDDAQCVTSASPVMYRASPMSQCDQMLAVLQSSGRPQSTFWLEKVFYKVILAFKYQTYCSQFWHRPFAKNSGPQLLRAGKKTGPSPQKIACNLIEKAAGLSNIYEKPQISNRTSIIRSQLCRFVWWWWSLAINWLKKSCATSLWQLDLNPFLRDCKNPFPRFLHFSMLFFRAGHLRYFFIFSLIKNDFFHFLSS